MRCEIVTRAEVVERLVPHFCVPGVYLSSANLLFLEFLRANEFNKLRVIKKHPNSTPAALTQSIVRWRSLRSKLRTNKLCH